MKSSVSTGRQIRYVLKTKVDTDSILLPLYLGPVRHCELSALWMWWGGGQGSAGASEAPVNCCPAGGTLLARSLMKLPPSSHPRAWHGGQGSAGDLGQLPSSASASRLHLKNLNMGPGVVWLKLLLGKGVYRRVWLRDNTVGTSSWVMSAPGASFVAVGGGNGPETAGSSGGITDPTPRNEGAPWCCPVGNALQEWGTPSRIQCPL